MLYIGECEKARRLFRGVLEVAGEVQARLKVFGSFRQLPHVTLGAPKVTESLSLLCDGLDAAGGLLPGLALVGGERDRSRRWTAPSRLRYVGTALLATPPL